MSRRLDVLSLVVGVLLSGAALAGLWLAFGGDVNWQWVKVGAPLMLVVVGLLGLTLSRNRE